jgi:hypothetical protein
VRVETPEGKAYVERLRERLEAAREQGLDVEATEEAISAAFTYAQALTLFPGYLDHILQVMAATDALAKGGLEPTGRWLKTEDGYVYTSPSGDTGRSLRDPPADVDPAEILDLPRLEPVMSGRERLGAFLDVLSAGDHPARLDQAIDLVTTRALNAWETSAPGVRESIWGEFTTPIWDTAFAFTTDEEPAPRSTAGSLHAKLVSGAESVRQAYQIMRADGALTALSTVLERLHTTIVEREDPSNEAVRITLTGIGITGTPEQTVAHAIRMAGQLGYTQAIETVAAAQLEAADGGIEAALSSAGRFGLYERLHSAAPEAWASFLLYHALANDEPASTQDDRLARIANAAEEKWIRLSESFRNAVEGLQKPVWLRHRAEVQELRREHGPAAAEQRVTQLVELMLYYPRRAGELMLLPEDPIPNGVDQGV